MSTSSKDAMDAAFDSQTGPTRVNTDLEPTFVNNLHKVGQISTEEHQAYWDARLANGRNAGRDPFEPEAAPAPSSDTAQVVGSMAHNVSDALAARDAQGKRVTLKGIQDRIESCVFINAAEAAGLGPRHPLACLTLALVTLDNGWTVVGKSACADPANFDPEKGKRFAIDDAIEQLWAPMAFELKERMWIAEELGLPAAIQARQRTLAAQCKR